MPQFRLRLATSAAVALVAISLCLAASRAASAQAIPVAYKTYDVSVFGGVSNTQQDFVPKRVYGEGFGLDVTRYLRYPFYPSLEARVNIADGTLINEHTYLFGLRFQTDYKGRFHPYADFLAGPGQIHYNYVKAGGFVGDNSTVYSYGGGIDVDLLRRFQLMADFQGQHWDLGHNLTFEPNVLTVGVAYRIPFRRHVKQSDGLYQ